MTAGSVRKSPMGQGGDPSDTASVHSAARTSDAVGTWLVLLDASGAIAAIDSGPAEAEAVRQAWLGRRYVDLALAMVPDLERTAFERTLADLSVGKLRGFRHGYCAPHAEGPRWRQLWITPLQMGGTAYLAALHQDLSGMEDASGLATAEQLLAAQEAERGRIACELHDSTNQHLVVMALGLTQLRRLLHLSRKSQDVLEDMVNAVQEMFREMRVVTYLMSTPALERAGLESAIRSFVSGFGIRTGLKASFRAQGQLAAAPPDIQHAVFRIVQESLSNIYRHAEASSVKVELSLSHEVLVVRIADDGKGMPIRDGGPADEAAVGVGIAGMRTRARQLGGRLDITSGGAGTRVEAVLPSPAPPRRRVAKARSSPVAAVGETLAIAAEAIRLRPNDDWEPEARHPSRGPGRRDVRPSEGAIFR